MPISLTRRRIEAMARKLPKSGDLDPVAVLDGDLQIAARKFARTARICGVKAEWWAIWREIQRERGLDFSAALAELSAEARQWFAVFALKHGAAEEGIEAYRLHLSSAKRHPFPHETALFLQALAGQGRVDEAVAAVDNLPNQGSDSPLEQSLVAIVLARRGDAGEALRRLAPIRRRYHDAPDPWAATAIALQFSGQAAEAKATAREAAKRGAIGDLRDDLIAFVVSAAEWAGWEQEFSPSGKVEDWRASPGAALVPAAGSDAPHWWGGERWRTSPCQGCGHPIRVWFTIDLTQVPLLREQFPGWRHFPLLGCVDCMVSMGRHDYRLDPNDLAVTLENVAIDCVEYGKPNDTTRAAPQRPVRLVPIDAATASEQDGDSGKALVGGVPLWTQQPERVWCPKCSEEMIYVAAMTSVEDFEPHICINNDSGFQYHFACAGCRVVSVIAQFT